MVNKSSREAGRKGMEAAREQVQRELLRYHEQSEQDAVADLRDERMRVSSRPLDINKVAGFGGFLGDLPGIALGAGIVLVLLEVASFLAGRGELITGLFR